MDAKFEDAFSDGGKIAKVSHLHLTHAPQDAHMSNAIAQTVQPHFEGPFGCFRLVDDQFDHKIIVA